MKKFKELINEVTLQWFAPMAKEKFNDFTKSPQLDLFNNQLMNVSKVDYNNELNAVLNEINSLESYADIVGYVTMNKLNLADSMDAAKLQDTVLKEGIKSLPKLLIKIQLGYISEVSERFFEEVRMWQDKLGRETEISDLQLDDLKYLIHVSLSKTVNEFKTVFANDPTVLNEVSEELEELSSLHSTLSQKRNDFTIIKIYFNKLRTHLFDHLNPTMLESNETLPENIAKQAQTLEKANALITQIEFILDFTSQLEKALKTK